MAKQTHPAITERQAMLDGLSNKLQDLARQIQEHASKTVKSVWMVGRLFSRAANEAEYGVDAVPRLATVTDYSVSYVYDLIRFATCFSGPTVEQLISVAQSKNAPLDLRHFMLATRIPDSKERENLLRQSMDFGWSSRQFEAHLKSQGRIGGGHSRARPFSPIQGLQKLTDNAAKLDQFVNSKAQEVLDTINNSAVEDISETLLQKFEVAHNMVSDTIASLSRTQERMIEVQEAISKRQRVVDAAGETDDASEDTATGTAESAGATKKPTGKPAKPGGGKPTKSAGKPTGKPASKPSDKPAGNPAKAPASGRPAKPAAANRPAKPAAAGAPKQAQRKPQGSPAKGRRK